MNIDKFYEPNKQLTDLYTSMYLNRQPIQESVSTDEEIEDEGDDGLDIEDADFEDIFESILGDSADLLEEDAQTEFDAGADPQVSPQGGGDPSGDDLSEFDDQGGEDEGGEEDTVAIPLSQLQGLYDILRAHFEGDEGGEPDGDEIMPADDEENFSNDELPTESAPTAGKKFIDSKITGFKSRANVKKPAVKPVKFDKSPKKHTAKSKLMKSGDKNWV
jgi:hypothetical protein